MEEEGLSFLDRLRGWRDEYLGFLYTELFTLEGGTVTIADILFPVLFFILLYYLSNRLRSLLIDRILPRYIEERKVYLSIGNVTKYVVLIVGVVAILASTEINWEFFNFKIISGEDPQHTLRFYDILKLIFFLSLLVFITGKLKTVFVKQVLSRYSEDIGVSQSIGTIMQYLIIILGGFVIIQNSGINLGSLNLLAGALGVGIGFGLQNIANNFISGLIILFERPVKVGDRIEVGAVTGDVIKISSRATTVNTNDNISIIIPNADVINKQVINWSHNDRNIRYHVPVGVSYSEDPAQIREILLDIAKKHPGVLKKPAPDVLFVEYGDSSLNFELMVWTNKFIDRPIILRSELYYKIFEKFKEQNIEIPFPQRDLHIKSGLPAPKS